MSITFEEMHINALKELYELNDLFKAFEKLGNAEDYLDLTEMELSTVEYEQAVSINSLNDNFSFKKELNNFTNIVSILKEMIVTNPIFHSLSKDDILQSVNNSINKKITLNSKKITKIMKSLSTSISIIALNNMYKDSWPICYMVIHCYDNLMTYCLISKEDYNSMKASKKSSLFDHLKLVNFGIVEDKFKYEIEKIY